MTAAPTTVNWLDMARDAYSASNSYFDASIRTAVEQDLRQFQGQHPAGSKYYGEAGRGRSKLFRPKTRAVIRKNEAIAAEAFFSTTDKISVTPENDNDPRRLASAAVMQELLQYRLTKSIPWFQTVIGAYQDAQAVGVVASYQYWEYNPKKKRDRPAIRLVPVENLRFDAGADWADPVNTSPYVIELIPMYLKDVRARMRTPDVKTGEPKWITLDDAAILQAAKNYTDSIRQQREGNRTDSKSQGAATNAFNIVWVHKNIIEVDEVDYCFYTLGDQAMLSKPVPLSDLYFHGRRPYTVGCAVIETHKTYPSSVPRLTRDVQAEINEVANSRIDNVKLVLNKRYFARRNRQVDLRSITRNVPGSVTLMQDIDDVKPVEFSDVTGSSYKEQEVLNLDFDDVSGSFSTSSVQSNRKLNETVGGMNLLSTSSNQVAGYQLRTFVETWVEPTLRQIVLLEQYYETNDTLVALCGNLAGITEKFGIDAVTDEMLMGEFTLNVNVGLGVTNPTEQVEQFMRGMNALKMVLDGGVLQQYGLKIEEVIKELFGKLGYRDGMRFFELGDEDPMIGQLKAQVQQLQQALDAKMPPELLAATIKKINAEIEALKPKAKLADAQATKTMVEAEFSAMQGAEVVASLPQVAPIADELMRAAGYTVPQPPGVDPNMVPPQVMPAQPAAPGMNLQQAAQASAGMLPTAPGDTTPNTPSSPVSPGMGERQGIETKRFDSVGMADGGLAEDDDGPLLSDVPRSDGNYWNPSAGFISRVTGLQSGQQVAVRRQTLAQAARASAAPPPAPGLMGHSLTTALMNNGLTDRLMDHGLTDNLMDHGLVSGMMDHSLVQGMLKNTIGYADGGQLADGGYVSVLERGDLAPPGSAPWRAYMEQHQALEGSHPEMMLAGPMRSIAQAARSAASSLLPRAARSTGPVPVAMGEAPGGLMGAEKYGLFPAETNGGGSMIGSRLGEGLPKSPEVYGHEAAKRDIDAAAGSVMGVFSNAQAQDYHTTASLIGNMFDQALPETSRTVKGMLGQQPAPPVYADGGLIPGLLEPGNIDLNNRPVVHNADGSVSTVRSMGVNMDGREVLIPTVAADGSRILSDDEAVKQYRSSGQHLGIFDTPENSSAYAQQLHQQQAKQYGYAGGGLIQGPGNGTSDSIAAQAGSQPIALSHGEYQIPPAVVQALGAKFFEQLVAKFHQPAQEQRATPQGAPLDIEPGSFIIPADVVQALGVGFFDALVARFGGQQGPAA